MKKTWTNGVSNAEELEAAFKASKTIRKRLEEICQNKIENSYKLSRSENNCPNWDLLQADSVGYKRALEEIISLIN